MTVREIKIDHIARIEGHGDVYIKASEEKVEKVELRVIEGARLFEALLRGRNYDEVADLTSRICGICCVSHQLTSFIAMERCMGVEETEQTGKLRELLYMGELIQSSTLHTYFLALPDFLGYPSAIAMASKYPTEVKRALQLKKLGNDIVDILGGRAIHPINTKLGGFRKLPKKADLGKLLDKLKTMREDAAITADLFLSLNMGDFERKTQTLSLGGTDNYEFSKGDIISPDGIKIQQDQYQNYLKEEVLDYSNTKVSNLNNKGFMVSALSRLNNNYKYLSEGAREKLEASDMILPSYKPLDINKAQAIELLYSIDHSIELLENLEYKLDNSEVTPRAGEGIAYTEAPRGLLMHHYKTDSTGKLTYANIITPTAANLKNIEEDIRKFVPSVIDKPKEEIIFGVEKLIRAYDPCISCSAHAIKVKIDFTF